MIRKKLAGKWVGLIDAMLSFKSGEWLVAVEIGQAVARAGGKVPEWGLHQRLNRLAFELDRVEHEWYLESRRGLGYRLIKRRELDER